MIVRATPVGSSGVMVLAGELPLQYRAKLASLRDGVGHRYG